jgi:hypothetical protein
VSLSTEIKSLLSTVSGLYIGDMPKTPDNAVAIYNTGGYKRDLTGTYVEEPTFMIHVRNSSYAAGEIVCSTVMDLLHGHTTTKLMMIENESGPMDLGRDENNRPKWSMNFRCYYRK